MKQYFILTCFAIISCVISLDVSAQTAEPIDALTLSEISYLAGIFQLPAVSYDPLYGVDAYRVTYEMPYLDSIITVSGAMFLPSGFDNTCSLPVMIYMHGTVFKRTNAPSYLPFEGQLGFLMSSPGYIVLMPDYVGLGTSDLMHPYVQATSEADAGIYLIQAAETLGAEMGFSFNGEFFSSGYSQGGHASMALSRELEANWSDTYPLIASAPLSGPYDISGTQFIETFNSVSYSNPAYLAYNIIGWNSYYGNLYTDLSEIFLEPYATELPGMFDGLTSVLEINAYLPILLDDLMQPGLINAIQSDPNHPFNIAAQDNDVYQWVPQSPLKMYYCTEDEQVFYQNTLVAETWMNDNGALNVSTSNGGPLNHGDCAGPAIFGGMLWMTSYHQECIPESVESISNDSIVWAISPNPAVNGSANLIGLPTDISWTIRDLTGRSISTGMGGKVPFYGLPEGIYLIDTEGFGTKRVILSK